MARSISFVVDEDVDTLVTITETSDGGLRFDVSVLGSGLLSDLRGFFFDLNGYDADAGGLSIVGVGANADVVSDANIGEAAVDRVGPSANAKGQVVKKLGKFDVGVEFGSPGIGRDTVQEASFELVSDTGALTLDSLDLADLGLRYMSTGKKIAAETSGVARNDVFTVMENDQNTIDLLANDTNGELPDGTRKTVTGAVNADGSTFTTADGGFEQAVVIGGLALGTVMVSADGYVTFVADGGDVDKLGHDAIRTFQFTYETTSADGNRATADVTLTIDGVNDTPVAFDVSGEVGEDDASDARDASLVGDGVTVAFSATDIDIGDTLSFEILSAPTDAFGNEYGEVVNNGDGTFTFNPLDNFQFLEEGEKRDVTFQYVAIDDSGVGQSVSSPEESDTSVARTATITVVGAFDAPLDHSASLLFETEDQSMFGTGAALVLQPELPFFGFDTGYRSLDATIIPSYTFSGDVLAGILDGIEAIGQFFADLGCGIASIFGGDCDADVDLPNSISTPRVGTDGFLDARVGLQPYFYLTSGDVDASVPVDVMFAYPRQVEAGDTFLIDSMYSIDGGATYSTMSPNVNFGMDFVFDIAAELALEFGSKVLDLFSFDTGDIAGFAGMLGEPGFNIFDFSAEDDLETSIDLGGLATLDLNFPVIETTGEQDAPGSETLTSEGEDDVAVLDIDVDAVVASLIKTATGVPVTFGEFRQFRSHCRHRRRDAEPAFDRIRLGPGRGEPDHHAQGDPAVRVEYRGSSVDGDARGRLGHQRLLAGRSDHGQRAGEQRVRRRCRRRCGRVHGLHCRCGHGRGVLQPDDTRTRHGSLHGAPSVRRRGDFGFRKRPA